MALNWAIGPSPWCIYFQVYDVYGIKREVFEF